jgi:hypothetical protein
LWSKQSNGGAVLQWLCSAFGRQPAATLSRAAVAAATVSTTGNAYIHPANAKASGMAMTSMILSLVSLFLCCLFLSVPGLIMGKMELNAVRDGRSPLASESYAKISYYMGIVATILSIVFYFFRFFQWAAEVSRPIN